MKRCVLYIVLYTSLTMSAHGQTATEDLQSYITNKRNDTNNELTFLRTAEGKHDYQIKLNFQVVNTAQLVNFCDFYSFQMFNKTYFVMGKDIYEGISRNRSLPFKKIGSIPNVKTNIVFVKSVQFAKLGFIVISYKANVSHIYKFKQLENVMHVQSLKHQEQLADAEFFITNKTLFLITVERNTFSKSTIIYKWLGNHFDEIENSLSINRVIDLITFQHMNYEILAILHGAHISDQKFLTLYEFNGRRPQKIQFFQIKEAYQVQKYTVAQKLYVLILAKEYNFIYRWDNPSTALIHHEQFQSISKIEKVITVSAGYNEFMFLLAKGGIHAYSTSLDTTTYLTHFNFGDPSAKIADAISKQNGLHVIAIDNDTELILTSINYTTQYTKSESRTAQDPLKSCMLTLQNKLEENLLRNQRNNDSELVSEVLNPKNERIYTYRRDHSDEIEQIVEPDINEFDEKSIDLKNKIIEIEEQISRIIPKIKGLYDNNELIINDTVFINGSLNAKNLAAQNINLRRINNIQWKPESWMSYKLPQTVTGPIKMKELKSNLITMQDKKTPLQDILLANGNQTLTGQVKLKYLQSTNLDGPSINGIPFNNIYVKSSPQLVTGLKQFKTLITENFNTTTKNENSHSTSTNLNDYSFAPNLEIDNLFIENIDEVNWKEFRNSIFQITETQKINGSITILKGNINHLITPKMNGTKVENLFTKSTKQNIKSKINFDHVEVENITVSTINGLNFASEVLLDETKQYVEGPVSVEEIKGINTTNIGSNSDNWKNVHGRINETKEKDFLQIYSTVKIKGNLHLKNINLSAGAKIILNEKEFKFENVSDTYWLKDTDQKIPVAVNMIGNVTTPGIRTNSLNGIPINNYMLNNNDIKLPTNYYFKNITILGNVLIDENMDHSPDLSLLNEKVVKINGSSSYAIAGKKVFNGSVAIKEANIDRINDDDVNDVLIAHSEKIYGNKYDTVIIKGDLEITDAKINMINGIKLDNINDNIILGTDDMNFQKLILKNITAENLEVKYINDKNFTDYLGIIDSINNIAEIEHVIVKKNVHINSVNNVTNINDVDFEIIEKAVSTGAVMEGNITFKNNIHIKNLTVNKINRMNIKEFTSRQLLYKDYFQIIHGKYQFDVLKTPHLVAKQINDHNIETLICVKRKTLQKMEGNFKFTSTKFLGSLEGKLPCSIKDVLKSLEHPPIRFWPSITILKNATILDSENPLSRILNKAVRFDRDNLITANVTFKSNIAATTIKAEKNINNISINEIYEDALLKSGNDQLVTGYKIFDKMSASGADVTGNAEIPIVNTISVQKLYNGTLRKDQIHNTTIRGHKIFFNGLRVNVLKTKSISGLKPEDLVNLDRLRPIPRAFIETLHVRNKVTINEINNINFNEFLNNRLLKKSDLQTLYGTIFFHKIKLKESSVIPTINNIDLDNVVTDYDSENITGSKYFTNNLVIYGDIEIEQLNDVNITDRYARSILINKEAHLGGDMVIEGVARIKGNITTNKINGISVDYIKKMIDSREPMGKKFEIDTIINQIKVILKETSSPLDMPEEYMYLETSRNLQINIPNTVHAEIFETNGYVMIHIIGEEPGFTCDLPNHCNCPVQQTFEITPEHSVQAITNKQLQRVYTFQSPNVIINLITNSVSINRMCSRTNSTNEFTILQWISPKINKSSQSHEHITGYLADAKFFTMSNNTYIVISRFYDANVDTHNLESLVLKFTHNTFEIVQRIPTKGAWTMHLFNSAQGLILVIGNIFDSETIINGTSTDIFIFNEKEEKFDLMRTVGGSGAISITDIVLDQETQIILAQKDEPLQILAYNHKHMNFYLFQSFNLESPVISVSKFYIGGNKKDAFLNVVTKNDEFFVYSYKYIEGWKLESNGRIQGLQALIPLTLSNQPYLFAPSTKVSSLLTVKKHGYN